MGLEITECVLIAPLTEAEMQLINEIKSKASAVTETSWYE